MTSTAEIERALITALGTIRDNWAALAESVEGGQSTGGASSTDSVTALDKLISLRHEVHMALNGWARVIVEDRPVTKEMPDGRDTLGLVDFIERHVQWLSGHEAARDAADELTEWAAKVYGVAAPKVREWVHLGDCPFVVGDEVAQWFCGGTVRARIGGEHEASCTHCEQSAVVDWWEEVLGIDTLPREPVDPQVIADLLSNRLHIRVTYRTVLNWARSNRITMHVAFGPQPEHPRFTSKSVFDARLVLDEAAHMWRECPMCGLLWHGRGDICARCYAASQVTQARWAEPRSDYPIISAPRRQTLTVVAPRDDLRPERCPYSDLPTEWCACGHAGHVGA
jgi:hypothetical protein